MHPARGAIVLGGTSGIGQRIVTRLADEGVPVVFTYAEAQKDALGLVEAAGNGIVPVRVDVTSPGDMTLLLRRATVELPSLDRLVFVVGVSANEPLERVSYETWRRTLDVNLYGALFAAQMIGPRMRDAGRGAIVNVSSVAAVRPLPRGHDYVVAKSGLEGLTRVLARTLAPELRVNAVAPCWIDTQRRPRTADASEILNKIRLRRFGTAEDVADAVLFLGNPDGYVTGHTLCTDGGYLLH